MNRNSGQFGQAGNSGNVGFKVAGRAANVNRADNGTGGNPKVSGKHAAKGASNRKTVSASEMASMQMKGGGSKI